MTTLVERWEVFLGEDLGGNVCIDDREDPHGRYVRFEDYDELMNLKNRWGQKAEEALASLTSANETSALLIKQRDQLREDVLYLEAELRTASLDLMLAESELVHLRDPGE